MVKTMYTRGQDAMWWEVRLWDVADGAPLTAKEAQALADWVMVPYQGVEKSSPP